MMDETTDVSGIELVSIVIRYIDTSDKVQERLLFFNTVPRTDAATLFMFLKDSLLSQGINLSHIYGQCYDGASNMKGEHVVYKRG